MRNRIALITGATSGIGKATAIKLAQNGFHLILTGRRKKRLASIKYKLEKNWKIKVKTLQFDVRHNKEVIAAIGSLRGKWATIDILINNAGLALGGGPIHEGNTNDWDTMIDTNVKGLLYVSKAVLGKMVKRQYGHVINIGSNSGREVYPGGNVYCASKFAVDALTRAMRLDLYKHHIKVSSVSSGHVETEFALVRFHGNKKKANVYEDFKPLSPEDIANTVYFMIDQPDHVNVQDVQVFSKQQASANYVDRSGRKDRQPK